MKEEMRLALGIDPGTALTGYGLVAERKDGLSLVSYGVIATPAEQPLAERLVLLYDRLTALVRHEKPSEVAVEEFFLGRNLRAAAAVYQAQGVALLAAAHQGLPVSTYTPLQVKQAIAKYGRARKEQVQEMVRLILNLEAVPQPDDAADAVAIAICHLESTRQARTLASLTSGGSLA